MSHESSGGSPVDNATYNLLQALTSKLEAIEAYRKYQHDGDQDLFTQLEQDERRQAEQLLQTLQGRLSGGGSSGGSSGGGGSSSVGSSGGGGSSSGGSSGGGGSSSGGGSAGGAGR